MQCWKCLIWFDSLCWKNCSSEGRIFLLLQNNEENCFIVQAVSEGITEMDCVAIAAHVEGDFVGPCGMCR